jgi:gamma-glutamylcysteine synthetase
VIVEKTEGDWTLFGFDLPETEGNVTVKIDLHALICTQDRQLITSSTENFLRKWESFLQFEPKHVYVKFSTKEGMVKAY